MKVFLVEMRTVFLPAEDAAAWMAPLALRTRGVLAQPGARGDLAVSAACIPPLAGRTALLCANKDKTKKEFNPDALLKKKNTI